MRRNPSEALCPFRLKRAQKSLGEFRAFVFRHRRKQVVIQRPLPAENFEGAQNPRGEFWAPSKFDRRCARSLPTPHAPARGEIVRTPHRGEISLISPHHRSRTCGRARPYERQVGRNRPNNASPPQKRI